MLRLPGFFFVVFMMLSTACSTVQIDAKPAYSPRTASLEAEQPGQSWWQYRFRLRWPGDEPPDFSYHSLLADQIFAPVLVEYADAISLWRFHRRAGRDSTGHQFSLIFYADDNTAQAMAVAIDSNPLTGWLLKQDLIEATRFDRRSPEELAALEDTSDREGPIEIQRSWPYFIMGVSQTWLLMVQELGAREPLSDTVSYEQMLNHYEDVNAALTAQWRDYGQHAYLHHLSAVFGYQPLKLRSTELKQF